MPDSIIITGDCLEILPTLPAASVNLVFTSPPYPGQKGNSQTVEGWLEWLAAAMRSLVPLLAPAAVIGLNVTLKRTPAGWFDSRLWTGVPAAIEAAGLNCLDTYIWNKTNAPQNGPRIYADAPGYLEPALSPQALAEAIAQSSVRHEALAAALAGTPLALNAEAQDAQGGQPRLRHAPALPS